MGRTSNLALSAALLAAAWGVPAEAKDWPSVAGWAVTEADTFCGLFRTYEGPGATNLAYTLDIDGTVIFSLINTGWSAKKGETYTDLSFELNGATYDGGKATGVEGGDYKGFTIAINDGFDKDFAAASSILVYKGDVLVDHLRLDGTRAALPTLKRCVAYLKAHAAATERERKRYEDIEKDPFAKNDSNEEAMDIRDPSMPQRANRLDGWPALSDPWGSSLAVKPAKVMSRP